MDSTIKDVAKTAGVSVATVSRVLNKSANVSDITAKRVLSAIETLGYRPNFLGRNLRKCETNVILAIIPSMEHTFYSGILKGMQNRANELGYDILISTSISDNSTVLRLSNLTKEELYLLLKNLRNVFAGGDESKYLVPDEALLAYLNHCANKIGDSYFRTPRNTIKGFLDLLSMLEQYPDLQWSDMIEKIEIVKDVESTEVGEIIAQQSEVQNIGENDVFASFKL